MPCALGWLSLEAGLWLRRYPCELVGFICGDFTSLHKCFDYPGGVGVCGNDGGDGTGGVVHNVHEAL